MKEYTEQILSVLEITVDRDKEHRHLVERQEFVDNALASIIEKSSYDMYKEKKFANAKIMWGDNSVRFSSMLTQLDVDYDSEAFAARYAGYPMMIACSMAMDDYRERISCNPAWVAHHLLEVMYARYEKHGDFCPEHVEMLCLLVDAACDMHEVEIKAMKKAVRELRD